jgi:hypothetical protein
MRLRKKHICVRGSARGRNRGANLRGTDFFILLWFICAPFGQHLKMKPTFIIIICTSRQLVLASFYFKGRIETQQQENIKGRQRSFFPICHGVFSPLVWSIKRSWQCKKKYTSVHIHSSPPRQVHKIIIYAVYMYFFLLPNLSRIGARKRICMNRR